MTTLLPTNNEAWGFWGTSSRNGYHAAMAWEAASTALVAAFDLTPIQVRDLLDSRLGRHLADDLSFIEGGPASPQAIEEHIRTRLADDRWRRWFERAVDDVRDAQRD